MANTKNSCVILTFIIGHVYTRQEQLKTRCSPLGRLEVGGTQLRSAQQGQNALPTDRVWPRASCPSGGQSTQLAAPKSGHSVSSKFQQQADEAARPEVPGGQTERGRGFGRSDSTRRDALRHVPPRSLRNKPPDCCHRFGRSCPSSPPPAPERGAAAGETPGREAALPAARRPVLTPCRRWALPGLQQRPAAAPLSAAPPARLYAAAAKNAKRGSQKARQEEAQKKKGHGRRPLLSKPVDDVYLTWYYERPSYDVEEAVNMLKKFQELDFTYPKQFVYINVTLDMELQKKKKVDQFASIVLLPYRFTDETNKVLVFTENEQEAEIARENGAAVVGGIELIKWILEEEIQMDFYIAVPAIMPKLIPLRSKLKQKYPSTRRNSLGHDIPKMLQFFREGLEYMVQDERLIKTRIARLDMPTEQIVANLKTIIEDICKFKPSSAGPFVKKLVIRSSTSEGLLLNLDGLLPEAEKAEEEEESAEDDEEKPVQESVST